MLDEQRCEFIDLGIVTTKVTDKLVTLDQARRCIPQARVLREKAPGCTTVVAEQLSYKRGARKQQLSIALSWGVVVGAVTMLNPAPRLLTIAPKRWQREVLPSATGEIDYDELARAAAAHLLRRHPKAHAVLQRIPASKRNHAVDAAMIALCGALRPHKCEVIAEGRAA